MKAFFVPLLVCCVAFSMITDVVFAQAPRTISYQGVLSDASGTPIADGQHQINVALYDSPTVLSPLFSEMFTVSTSKGIFNIVLGTVTPIPAMLDFNRTYYLGTSVDNGSELSPRTAFTAVPYAIHAEKAESATTATTANALASGATGVVTSVNGAEGALTLQGGGGTTISRNGSTITVTSSGGSATGITGIQNTDGTIQIQNPNGPVANIAVADNGITSTKLADNAVTTSKIGDGMVTSEKLGVNSVNAIHLIMNAVTNDKIENGAVTGSKLADGAVNGDKIANDAVNTTHLIMNAVTNDKISNAAVTAEKIADGTVSLDKIDPNGASANNVIMYNGSTVTWGQPAIVTQMTLPIRDTINESQPAIVCYNESYFGIDSRAVAPWSAVLGIQVDGSSVKLIPNAGVSGSSPAGRGVAGYSTSGSGVIGRSETGIAGVFEIVDNTSSSVAVKATTQGSGDGVYATVSNGCGVRASSFSGYGVYTTSESGVGLRAISTSGNIIEAVGASSNLRFRVLQSGDVRCDGAFTGGGADLAEAFEVSGQKSDYEPGDVMVLSPTEAMKVTRSSSPNSTLVAGVYATKPGVLLTHYETEEPIEHLLPLGITGVVPTKVCSENGPIGIGDLLVTSSRPGHAMKAVPTVVGGVPIYPAGAILGKALEPFSGTGTGMIKVLVNVK